MHLLTAAFIVSMGIILSCLLPLRFQAVRNHSKALLFVGSLVLLGFCLFDLIPETFEMGGLLAIAIMAVSWAIFVGIHAVQTRSHGHGMHNHSAAFLLGSMALHCFSGGMLLVTSYSISAQLAFHVFLGLIGHKVFEGVSIASILAEKAKSKKELYLYVSVYALSFPAGVAVTAGAQHLLAETLSKDSIEGIAMVITSIAIGSLMGCLLQDFLVPSIQNFRTGFARIPSKAA